MVLMLVEYVQIVVIKDGGKNKYDNWYDISSAADITKSLDTILNYYYNSSGKSIIINSKTFNNIIPKYKLKKAKNYTKINTNWCCGNNAINIWYKTIKFITI